MKNGTNGDPVSSQLLDELGRRLRVAREACGMSVEAASSASGVKSAMIGRYERSESEAGALKIAALAETYGVCCNWLLGQAPQMDDLKDVHAVVDLDMAERIDKAATEADMRKLICYDPAPFLAIIGIPKRHKVISAHSASVLGARIYDRLSTIAPRAHRQWANNYALGGVT